MGITSLKQTMRLIIIINKKAMIIDFMEEQIITLLEIGERHFDELLELTELSPSELSSLLSRMEVCGLIKDLLGLSRGGSDHRLTLSLKFSQLLFLVHACKEHLGVAHKVTCNYS